MNRVQLLRKLGRVMWGNPKPQSDLDRQLSKCHERLQQLGQLSTPLPPVLEREVVARLAAHDEEVGTFLNRTLSFESTETWRSVYQDVLSSCRLKRYLSVALVDSDGYWRDLPGKNSLEFNYRLATAGYFLHRLFIIDDYYWPRASQLPEKELLSWITEQFHLGIETSLVRVSALELERDLLADFGIYGDEAVGYQDTGHDGRTLQFKLHFDCAKVAEAERRWNQLHLYTTRLEALLDQANENR